MEGIDDIPLVNYGDPYPDIWATLLLIHKQSSDVPNNSIILVIEVWIYARTIEIDSIPITPMVGHTRDVRPTMT